MISIPKPLKTSMPITAPKAALSTSIEEVEVCPTAQNTEPLYKGFSVKDGKIFYNFSNSEAIYVFQKVTLQAIKRDIDLDSFSFEISFDYLGHRKVITVPRAVCLTKRSLLKLQDEGLDITEKSAPYAVMYFQNEEHLLSRKGFTQTHKTVGFGRLGLAEIFKGYETIGTDSRYVGSLDIKPCGNKYEWLNLTLKHIVGHPQREVILGIGLSSAIVGMLGLDSLFVHLPGNSTTGKTTMAKYAVSIWGNPSTKPNSLARSWFGTENAILAALSGNHGMTTLLDEVSTSSAQDFSNFIYTISGNTGKSRLNEFSEMQRSGSWSTTVLSTGEFNLLEKSKRNVGLKMRLLELGNVEWTDSASTSDSILTGISENYGHAGIQFSEYLLDMGAQALRKRLDQTRLIAMEAMHQRGIRDQYASRRAQKYALILCAVDLANDVFGLGIKIEDLYEFLFGFEIKEALERDLAKTALDYLSEQVSRSASKFPSTATSSCPNDIMGRVQEVNGGFEVIILPEVFKRIMRDGGFEDSMMILKDWKSKRILNAEGDRLTRTRKLFADRPAVKVYVIKICENSIKSSD